MKKPIKTVAVLTGCALTLNVFSGCTRWDIYTSERLEELAETLAVMFIGDDAYTFNVMSVDPKESYGVDLDGEPSWYSYSPASDSDINSGLTALRMFDKELSKYNPSKLSEKSAATYRYARQVLDTYLEYYESPYAKQFSLIGADYINSQGGYVADFASAVENYSFRNKTDVDNLLSITLSTDEAFGTYLDYVDDRADAGYPLYYYTINAMQEYLDDVSEHGDDYYLYSFVDKKIDNTTFLSQAEKTEYKTKFDSALSNHFMRGVENLSSGLKSRKGTESAVKQSYLAEYGKVGQAYYDWCFKSKTGMKSVNYNSLYNELITALQKYYRKMNRISADADDLSAEEKADFDAYMEGDKVLLGITDPEEILTYLKTAAKSIVPDLKSEPNIDFKYMDDTVAQITNTVAYYLHSPADEDNSPEHITLNPHSATGNPEELLTTIAHEGYPGHLYAYVNAKESGSNLLSLMFSCTAFSEGWAKYTEYAILNHIASESDSEAVKLYCEYTGYDMLVNFISMVLYDIEVNYFGETVQSYVSSGLEESVATEIVEMLMEMPTVYVPYGYGVYTMVELHNSARNVLGDEYNEVEFNKRLLAEGPAPTLDRAREIAEEYKNA